MAKKIEVVLALLDKATGPLQAFNKRIEAIEEPIRKINNKLVLFGRESGITRVSAQLGNVASAAGNVVRQLAYVGGALGGAAFGFKAAFIDTAAQFERFETILTTIEGSSAKARQSMDWISQFATKTPYELAEVTDAFVKLRAYGMEPTNGLLKSLGDTAAAMGKPLMAAIEAIADAVTGENERLKEFGIKARKQGQMIVYEYTENGKTMRAQAKASNRAQIQATLEAIFNKKYSGAMDKLSGTWGGMLSNISDQWTRFAKMVMDSGPFEILRGRLSNFLAKLDQMAASGELARIAEEWGAKISDALERIWNVGVRLFNFIERFVNLVGGFENALTIVAAVAAGPLLLSLITLGSAIAKLGVILLTTPIGWFIGIVAALAAAAFLVYKNWEPIKAFFVGIWNEPMKALETFVNFVNEKLGWLFKNSPWGMVLNGIVKVGAMVGGAQPAGVAPVAAGAVGGQGQTVTNNAKVEVDFKNVPRGTSVRPAENNRAPLDLSMGYSGVW